MVKEKISSKFSFKGWNIKEFLYRNKDFFKWFVPGLLTFLITNGIMEAGLAAIIGKFILDILDFYITDVKLK